MKVYIVRDSREIFGVITAFETTSKEVNQIVDEIKQDFGIESDEYNIDTLVERLPKDCTYIDFIDDEETIWF